MFEHPMAQIGGVEPIIEGSFLRTSEAGKNGAAPPSAFVAKEIPADDQDARGYPGRHVFSIDWREHPEFSLEKSLGRFSKHRMAWVLHRDQVIGQKFMVNTRPIEFLEVLHWPKADHLDHSHLIVPEGLARKQIKNLSRLLGGLVEPLLASDSEPVDGQIR